MASALLQCVSRKGDRTVAHVKRPTGDQMSHTSIKIKLQYTFKMVAGPSCEPTFNICYSALPSEKCATTEKTTIKLGYQKCVWFFCVAVEVQFSQGHGVL